MTQLFFLQVSLVGQPDFSFDLNVYGGDLTILPGLEGFLSGFIRDIVLQPYVLPEKLVFPLVAGQCCPLVYQPPPFGTRLSLSAYCPAVVLSAQSTF